LLVILLLSTFPPLITPSVPPNSASAASTPTLLTPGVHLIPCKDVNSSSPCARVLVPSFISPSSSSLLLSLATSVFSLTPGGSGPVTIFDLISGALSYHDQFINAQSLLSQHSLSLPLPPLSLYLSLTDLIKQEIRATLNLTEPLYLTRPSFFAQIDGAKEAVTAHDEYWHTHCDEEQYGSFEFTALIYLAQWGEDFTGGEFVFRDEEGEGQHERNMTVDVKDGEQVGVEREGVASLGVREWEVHPSPGSLLFFTSGHENLHHVTRVTTGRRSTLTIAFTTSEQHSVETILQQRYGRQVKEWRESLDTDNTAE
jgi:hypothetical protein